MNGGKPGHLPQLDGLRAGAVALVVVYHVVQKGHGPLVHGAFVGVDIFFVLSGFLITSLLIKERERTGTVRLIAFYRRRWWRLYPGLLMACVASAAWFALAPGDLVPDPTLAKDTPLGALLALLYASCWAVSLGGPVGYLGHTWSLSVEEHFYLLWPMGLLLLLRLRTLSLARSIGLLTVVAAAWPLALEGLHSTPGRIYASPDGRAGQLLLGCLAAALLARPGGLGRLAPLASAQSAAIALVVLALAVIGLRRQYALYLGPGQVVVALAAAVLITHLVLHEGRLSRLLSWRPAVVVGTWSYGIYLWHAVMLLVPYAVFGAGIAPRALGALLAVAVAGLSYRFVERPLLARYGTTAASELPERKLPGALEPV